MIPTAADRLFATLKPWGWDLAVATPTPPTDEEIAAMEVELAEIEAEMVRLYGVDRGPCDECGTVYHTSAPGCPACGAPPSK